MTNAAANPRKVAAMPSAHMSKGSWERFQSVSEIFLLFSCAIVVAGLALEDWTISAVSVGHIAVIAGVMLEGLADGGILLASRKLQALQERELEEMRLETAQANASAAEANARAAEANVELWKLRTPRMLSDAQREQLISLLRAIDNKCRVDIYALVAHDEIRGLQSELLSVLNQAKWDARTNFNSRIPQPGIVNGLIVEVNAGISPQLRMTATLIASALRKAGLHTVGPQSSYTMRDAPIEILVGPKP
jgi:hypothetical protein